MQPRPARITRSSEGFLAFSVEIDPAVQNVVENIRHMRRAVLDGVFAVAQRLAPEMEAWAEENAPWYDHDDRHPSLRYPSSQTARQNLTAFAEMEGDNIRITIAHSPETIMVTKRGRVVTYGGILESNYHGPYAILQPTLAEFGDRLLELSEGAALVGYKKSRPGG